jgi:hypothetical protein
MAPDLLIRISFGVYCDIFVFILVSILSIRAVAQTVRSLFTAT